MAKNYNLRLLVVALLLSLIFSCSDDDDYYSIDKQKSGLLVKAKEWLHSKNVLDDNDVNWYSATFYQQSSESSFVAVIPITSHSNYQIQKLVLEINNYNITGKLWSFNFEEAQIISNLQMTSTHKLLESFAGELKITDLETMKTLRNTYKKGGHKTTNLFSKFSDSEFPDTGCKGCHWTIQLDEVIIPPNPKPIWFTIDIDPSTPSFPFSPYGITIIPAKTQLQIFINLKGKEKCVNDLLDKEGDSFVKNLLSNFKGDSEFNIEIVSKYKVTKTEGGIITELNGGTAPPVGNLIRIEISTSRANINSTLDVARTILHEYIHADMYRKLNTRNQDSQDVLDFKKTYEAYENQHGAMGALYIDKMKESLKNFHKNQLTDDYNKYTNYFGEAPSDAFYEALAWGGLKDADVKSWRDLPADKKASIGALSKRVPLLSKSVPCPN